MRNIYTSLLLTLFAFQYISAQTAASDQPVIIQNKSGVTEIRTGGYNFINPLLDYYDINSSSLASNKLLQKKLNDYIGKQTAANLITSASVYYRDLNNGPWIGIHESEMYSPASLLKVPYLMAALKQAELDPTFLTKQDVYIPNGNNQERNIKDGFSLIPGNIYTMQELISAMIIHSDNDAKDMLVKNIPYPVYKEIFSDLGIDIQKYDTISNAANFLTVKEYASFFRVLYNATFLNKKMSEYALWLLSETTFNVGIKAGLPDSVKISHKFGERFYENTDIKQLHDCGIVYKPGEPYILCVMTKGTDLKKMEKIIEEISRIIYIHLDQKGN